MAMLNKKVLTIGQRFPKLRHNSYFLSYTDFFLLDKEFDYERYFETCECNR